MDESGQITSILLFFICMLMSAFFSASETAFTSISKSKLEILAKDGNDRAIKALKLHENYDDLLSTILIGNNIVNIAASSIATVFFVNIMPLYGALISTIVTTILLLIFSEISPKMIAKIMPEDIALKFTSGLNFFMIILKPLVWIMSLIQNLIKRVVPERENKNFSEEILMHLVDEAKIEGSIEAEEHDLVTRAMEFDDETVSSILIPRVDVVAVDVNDSDEEIQNTFNESTYSRLIVYDDSIDKILGMIHQKDFNKYMNIKREAGIKQDVRSIISEIIYIPGTISLADALKLMQREKMHMAAIIDEHGGFEGIITMEDLLEELVGDIWDESDKVEQDIKTLIKGKLYELNGRMDLDEAFEFLNITDEDDKFYSNTLSGFVIEILDKMPEVNDSFLYEDKRFTVKEVENNRVEKVIVRLLKEDN